MPQNEKILWTALQLLYENSVTSSTETSGQKTPEIRTEHACIVGELKGELVLKYLPNDIEDTIYFLKNRGYLTIHGHGIMAPERFYSLSEKAIEVFKKKKLPPEEENAFKEALWKFDLNFYGVRPNAPEGWKRLKKWFGQK